MRWLDGITDSMDMNLGKLQETVKNREDWSPIVHGSQRVGDTDVENNCMDIKGEEGMGGIRRLGLTYTYY